VATTEEEIRGIGHSVKRQEDERFIRGRGNYVDDVVLPGMLHLELLRSPYAHARIKSIDTSAAEAAPGVVMIITHANCPDVPYGCAGQGAPEPSPYDRRMFDTVLRHQGDRVAAVVAETDEAADAALALIKVE
jgi:putative selenate reductase molybdopterin-binding subunit